MGACSRVQAQHHNLHASRFKMLVAFVGGRSVMRLDVAKPKSINHLSNFGKMRKQHGLCPNMYVRLILTNKADSPVS